MFRKDMSILEALQEHPRARDVFKKHGMACLGCMGAMQESIEAGAQMHGLDIEVLMKELIGLQDSETQG